MTSFPDLLDGSGRSADGDPSHVIISMLDVCGRSFTGLGDVFGLLLNGNTDWQTGEKLGSATRSMQDCPIWRAQVCRVMGDVITNLAE